VSVPLSRPRPRQAISHPLRGSAGTGVVAPHAFLRSFPRGAAAVREHGGHDSPAPVLPQIWETSKEAERGPSSATRFRDKSIKSLKRAKGPPLYDEGVLEVALADDPFAPVRWLLTAVVVAVIVLGVGAVLFMLASPEVKAIAVGIAAGLIGVGVLLGKAIDAWGWRPPIAAIAVTAATVLIARTTFRITSDDFLHAEFWILGLGVALAFFSLFCLKWKLPDSAFLALVPLAGSVMAARFGRRSLEANRLESDRRARAYAEANERRAQEEVRQRQEAARRDELFREQDKQREQRRLAEDQEREDKERQIREERERDRRALAAETERKRQHEEALQAALQSALSESMRDESAGGIKKRVRAVLAALYVEVDARIASPVQLRRVASRALLSEILSFRALRALEDEGMVKTRRPPTQTEWQDVLVELTRDGLERMHREEHIAVKYQQKIKQNHGQVGQGEHVEQTQITGLNTQELLAIFETLRQGVETVDDEAEREELQMVVQDLEESARSPATDAQVVERRIGILRRLADRVGSEALTTATKEGTTALMRLLEQLGN